MEKMAQGVYYYYFFNPTFISSPKAASAHNIPSSSGFLTFIFSEWVKPIQEVFLQF